MKKVEPLTIRPGDEFATGTMSHWGVGLSFKVVEIDPLPKRSRGVATIVRKGWGPMFFKKVTGSTFCEWIRSGVIVMPQNGIERAIKVIKRRDAV